nr:adenylate cyclase type 9-like [Oncorhynchus nerka]
MVTMETPPATVLGLATAAGLLELVSLVLSIRMTFYLDNVLSCTQTLLRVVSGWIPRHVIGAVLVSLPAVSVFSHLACSLHLPIQVRRDREGTGGGQTWGSSQGSSKGV